MKKLTKNLLLDYIEGDNISKELLLGGNCNRDEKINDTHYDTGGGCGPFLSYRGIYDGPSIFEDAIEIIESSELEEKPKQPEGTVVKHVGSIKVFAIPFTNIKGVEKILRNYVEEFEDNPNIEITLEKFLTE